MKKVLVCGLIAVSFVTTSVLAGSVGGDFQVKAVVTPTCVADNATMPLIDFGTIAAFSSTAIANKTADIGFKCSKNLAPTSATLSATSGTVSGLTYGLSVGATPAVTTGTGLTGDRYVYTVTGTMASGQAGDSTDPDTKTQTLTIAF